MSISKTFLMILLALASCSSASALTLDWEIGNRFRAFDYLASKDHDPQKKAMELFNRYAPRADEEDLRLWLARLLEESKGTNLISPYSFPSESGPWLEKNSNEEPNYRKDFVELPSFLAIKLTLKSTTAGEMLPSGECEARSVNTTPVKGLCNGTITLKNFPSTGGLVQLFQGDNLLSSADINPSSKIVLGLGDSYAAGEGAPDFPTVWTPGISDAEWPFGKDEKVYYWTKTPASWWSNRCNRSFFSAQSATALKLARENPHSVISFVHLACAGAEVVDGLLAPQRMAPGHPVKNCDPAGKRKDYNQLDQRCDVPTSQFRAAVKLLCKTSPIDLPQHTLASIKQPLNQVYKKTDKDQRPWINDLQVCPAGNLRNPDLVLVGIGGNDVGFSGVITWGLIPIGSRHPGANLKKIITNFITGIARDKVGVVCPKEDMVGCGKETSAYSRIRDLPYRYEALATALDTLLGVSGRQVVLPNYPNPLLDEQGNICGNEPGENKNNEWYATRMLIPSLASPKKWQINLTKWEAGEVEKWVIQPLNDAIFAEGNKQDWILPDVSNAMVGHGWCTGPDRELLEPKVLASWNGYQDRVRMIRISNDTVVTQWPDTSRADWISGTFHPNAWGYATVANEIVKAIKTGGNF